MRELLEHGEHEFMRFVPLIAAVLAVLAGLSSLYGNRLSERMLTLKNEAVLHEVTASDLWAEYQAQSIKGHLYEIAAQTQAGKSGVQLKAKAAAYKAEQAPIRAGAQRNEAERDRDLVASQNAEVRKGRFDVAVALFEIAIVLTSVAALTRIAWLLALAGLGGLVALFFSVQGLFGAG